MNYHRVRKGLVTLGAIIIALTLSGAEGCEETHPSAPQPPPPRNAPKTPAQPPQPTPKPGDPEPHGRMIVTVRFGDFEQKYLPYNYVVTARNGKPNRIENIVTNTTQFGLTIYYDQSVGVIVNAQLKPGGHGATSAFCVVEGGGKSDGPRRIAGSFSTSCFLSIPPKK